MYATYTRRHEERASTVQNLSALEHSIWKGEVRGKFRTHTELERKHQGAGALETKEGTLRILVKPEEELSITAKVLKRQYMSVQHTLSS